MCVLSRRLPARLLERVTGRVHARSNSVAVSSRLVAGPPSEILAKAGADDLVVVGHSHRPADHASGLAMAEWIVSRHSGPALDVRPRAAR